MKYLIPFLKIVDFGIIPADVPVSPNPQSTDVKSNSLFKLTAPNSITPKLQFMLIIQRGGMFIVYCL